MACQRTALDGSPRRRNTGQTAESFPWEAVEVGPTLQPIETAAAMGMVLKPQWRITRTEMGESGSHAVRPKHC